MQSRWAAPTNRSPKISPKISPIPEDPPKPEKPEKKAPAVDYVAECEKSLSKHLGRKVKIVTGKKKGRFELEFYDQDDLQKLLDALMKLQK